MLVISISLPIDTIFITTIIVYALVHNDNKNLFGLGLLLNNKAAKTVFFIIGLIIIYSIGAAAVLISDTPDLADSHEALEDVIDTIPRDIADMVGITQPFIDAVAQGNIGNTISEGWMFMGSIIVVAPIIENVLFIAILFPAFYRKFGYPIALIIVTTCFTAIHIPQMFFLMPGQEFTFFDLFSILSGIIMGGIMIISYVETDSLYPSIVFHAGWNYFVVFSVSLEAWGKPVTTIISSIEYSHKLFG